MCCRWQVNERLGINTSASRERGAYVAGWAFNAGGGCEAIPQGGDPGNPRACAISYPCVVRQEMLWVKLVPQPLSLATDSSGVDGPDISDIPIIQETEVCKLHGS